MKISSKSITTRFLVLTILILPFVFILHISTAGANAAPPSYPSGANLDPGKKLTNVQMVSEKVIMEVQGGPYPKKLPDEMYLEPNGWAAVTATFWMLNQGNTEEHLKVQFPLENSFGYMYNMYDDPVYIENLTVHVDGQPVATTQIAASGYGYDSDNDILWAAFDVDFPPGQEVVLQVQYYALGLWYEPWVSFDYILETGAGWWGNIESADIIVRLPYEASFENVYYPPNNDTPPEFVFEGRDIRWHLSDFEPDILSNIRVRIIEVDRWQEVLRTRRLVEANPENGDAWGAYGRACKLTVIDHGPPFGRVDVGGEELFEKCVMAYEHAVELSPQVARWHAGFAELLLLKAGYANFLRDRDRYEHIAYQLALELNTALNLDPDNQQAKDGLENCSGLPGIVRKQDDGTYNFLILTMTPSPSPTYTTTKRVDEPLVSATERVPQMTKTPIPSDTITPVHTPSQSTWTAASQAILPATETPTVEVVTPAASNSSHRWWIVLVALAGLGAIAGYFFMRQTSSS